MSSPGFATFESDLSFLKRHLETVELECEEGRLAVIPAYQGRAMTSTDGQSGFSYGWINRELIESGESRPHINAFGGEDRFWLGPEGGQFSIFFRPGEPFDLEHWQTPAPIDSEPFEVNRTGVDEIALSQTFEVQNWSGFTFRLRADRTVRMLPRRRGAELLGLSLAPDLGYVGFETINGVTNVGDHPWSEASGLLSLWNLGMFTASPAVTVVIPISPEAGEGDEIVNDRYFGSVSSDRLKVAGDAVFFRGDARSRGKIGIGPRYATPILGSYDAERSALTVVQYSLPKDPDRYVDSTWALQSDPFAGDVINSYNDGPAVPSGAQLGRFYELETSSPALALAPGERGVHIHRTFHVQGPAEGLNAVAETAFGRPLSAIVQALP